MSKQHEFAVNLAKAGETPKRIMEMVEKAFPGKGLKKTAVYEIAKRVREGGDTEDRRGKARTGLMRDEAFISEVEGIVQRDRRVTVKELAELLNVSVFTIHKCLKDDLGLVKKSARWVPKLLNNAQKEERVRCSNEFLNKFQRDGQAFLDRVVTMDESAVSYHTPETKQQSKQWLKKGTPGPIKARSQATRTKQMVLAFFDAKGLIYTNIVPRGQTVNADYIITALQLFWRRLRLKRPDLFKNGFVFHWDNAPVHTAGKVKTFLQKKNVELLEHPPYSPDLAPADYFLFPKVKADLAGDYMDVDSFKTKWDGVTSKLKEEAFANAYQKWVDRHRKCVRLDGDYVEKS